MFQHDLSNVCPSPCSSLTCLLSQTVAAGCASAPFLGWLTLSRNPVLLPQRSCPSLLCEHREQAIERLLNPQWQGPIKNSFFSISFNDFYYQPPFSLRFSNNNNRRMQHSAFPYLMLPYFFFCFNEFLFAPMGCWNKHKAVQDSAYCSVCTYCISMRICI